jgi:hypothetical protein
MKWVRRWEGANRGRRGAYPPCTARACVCMCLCARVCVGVFLVSLHYTFPFLASTSSPSPPFKPHGPIRLLELLSLPTTGEGYDPTIDTQVYNMLTFNAANNSH